MCVCVCVCASKHVWEGEGDEERSGRGHLCLYFCVGMFMHVCCVSVGWIRKTELDFYSEHF